MPDVPDPTNVPDPAGEHGRALPGRKRDVDATRRRIAEAALDLFQRRGYADTTIDQIAAAAGVGRRTIFRYFPTKEAIVVDHLAVRREVALHRLRQRPVSEPLLVSLHAVLRELAEHGYDRTLLAQIRAVVTTDPGLARDELSVGGYVFEKKAVTALAGRPGEARPRHEIHAVTFMTAGWLMTATYLYLVEGRRSLLECFDEVVAICTRELGAALPLTPE